MDPLTHSLVGALSAKTAGVSRKRLWIMVGLSLVMDLDVLAHGGGVGTSLFHHRGITHSILGVVILTFLFSWAFRKWDSGPFPERTFHYFLPLSLHLLCDAITHFGVPLYSPFILKEMSFNLTGSLVFIPTVAMILGLIWFQRRNFSGWRKTAWVWMVWAGYFAVAGSAKIYAGQILAPQNEKMVTIPSLSNPFKWMGVLWDEENHVYRQFNMNVLAGLPHHTISFSGPNGDFPVQASLESPEVEKMLQEYRWPLVRYTESTSGWDVEWGNLIYSVRGMVRGRVRVQLDKNGNIIKEEKIINFWDPEILS